MIILQLNFNCLKFCLSTYHVPSAKVWENSFKKRMQFHKIMYLNILSGVEYWRIRFSYSIIFLALKPIDRSSSELIPCSIFNSLSDISSISSTTLQSAEKWKKIHLSKTKSCFFRHKLIPHSFFCHYPRIPSKISFNTLKSRYSGQIHQTLFVHYIE